MKCYNCELLEKNEMKNEKGLGLMKSLRAPFWETPLLAIRVLNYMVDFKLYRDVLNIMI